MLTVSDLLHRTLSAFTKTLSKQNVKILWINLQQNVQSLDKHAIFRHSGSPKLWLHMKHRHKNNLTALIHIPRGTLELPLTSDVGKETVREYHTWKSSASLSGAEVNKKSLNSPYGRSK